MENCQQCATLYANGLKCQYKRIDNSLLAGDIRVMAQKTAQLQIRVSPEQKRTLRRMAREAGTDMSSWILNRVLPAETAAFHRLVASFAQADGRSIALAELSEYLRGLSAGAFARAVADAPRVSLTAARLSYLAAAIDRAAANRELESPEWARKAPVPLEPQVGSRLASVRLHLLTMGPVAFRRRNIFVDASIDERV